METIPSDVSSKTYHLRDFRLVGQRYSEFVVRLVNEQDTSFQWIELYDGDKKIEGIHLGASELGYVGQQVDRASYKGEYLSGFKAERGWIAELVTGTRRGGLQTYMTKTVEAETEKRPKHKMIYNTGPDKAGHSSSAIYTYDFPSGHGIVIRLTVATGERAKSSFSVQIVGSDRKSQITFGYGEEALEKVSFVGDVFDRLISRETAIVATRSSIPEDAGLLIPQDYTIERYIRFTSADPKAGVSVTPAQLRQNKRLSNLVNRELGYDWERISRVNIMGTFINLVSNIDSLQPDNPLAKIAYFTGE